MTMVSLRYKLKLSIVFFLLFIVARTSGQTKCWVVDKTTNEPIAHVSIYANTPEGIKGTVSDESGQFSVIQQTDSISFAHISYFDSTIHVKNLIDTIFLRSRCIILNEVIVNTDQPNSDWIENILRETIKNKVSYLPVNSAFNYDYQTYTLSESSGYAFFSEGTIHSDSEKKDEIYRINPITNSIHFKDTTAGTDFHNFRRLIYDDFIKKLNKRFIKNSYFTVDESFKSTGVNELLFAFRSKIDEEVTGYLLVDTLNKVLLEFELVAGTDYNIKKNTSALYRGYAKTVGFEYNVWKTTLRGKFVKEGSTYRLLTGAYKFYMKTTQKKDKRYASYFTSTEAQLNLTQTKVKDAPNWLLLPKPFYIGIGTKELKLAENALQSVDVTYSDFDKTQK